MFSAPEKGQKAEQIVLPVPAFPHQVLDSGVGPGREYPLLLNQLVVFHLNPLKLLENPTGQPIPLPGSGNPALSEP